MQRSMSSGMVGLGEIDGDWLGLVDIDMVPRRKRTLRA
jgi:hypothetical protein